MADRYRCILLFGAPGTGKGTQGQLLGERDGFVHLATGDIFRSLDKETELGRKFVHYSSRGELVPNDLTIQLWQEYVKGMIADGRYDPESDILLLDGMPRSLPQAEMLDGLLQPLAIIHLTVPNIDEMVKRMKLRAEKEGRHDDADENVIRNRFDVYNRETAPVLGHFDKRLVIDIDAIGTIEEVFERAVAAVDSVRV
ncbi:MAG: nucleoside monophosphate kinase [Phycisphaerales bacterium]|nr:MAG: nucleoside monophosphate kinase [Phycisphaerales bacterium]